MPVKKQTTTDDVKDTNLKPAPKKRAVAKAPVEETATVADVAPVETTPVINAPLVSTPAAPVVSKPIMSAPIPERSNMGYRSGTGSSSQMSSAPRRTYSSNGNSMNSQNSRVGGYINYQKQTAPLSGSDEGQYYTGEVVNISGMLEVLPDYGVIRQKQKSEDNLPRDVYISHSQIKRFNLRMGDFIKGTARPPKEGERYLSLIKIESVEDMEPELARKRPHFTDLTPIFPNKWLKLETTGDILATRLIDLVAPIGKGQRAMVVAPPKAGKTWLLKDIANGITTNYPEIVLLVALIGERPEEVTHFSRSVKGEVFASNFDEKAEEQTRISELCLEHAKRLAEKGKDVVILMDSLTRLARAYNMVAPPSGRTLTGGFDPAALYPAKHFFGAARNLEEGGSLTIIATALVDTGSRMDDVIFEEFKGTGNMELRLDRTLYERRVFPTIDIKGSGTRHEEHLFDKDTFDQVIRLRRMVDFLDDKEATERVLERLKKYKSNQEFLTTLHTGA